jgi:hypothetical protein
MKLYIFIMGCTNEKLSIKEKKNIKQNEMSINNNLNESKNEKIEIIQKKKIEFTINNNENQENKGR